MANTGGPRQVVAIPIATPKTHYDPNNPPTKKTYCLWTQRAIEALEVPADAVGFKEGQQQNTNYIYVESVRTLGYNHWTFYIEVSSTVNNQTVKKQKGYQVPCGKARVRDVIRFAYKLPKVVRIRSPKGQSYRFLPNRNVNNDPFTNTTTTT